MQRIVNQEEARVAWGLDSWWEKTIYVVGYITAVVIVSSFLIGFIVGLVQSTQGY